MSETGTALRWAVIRRPPAWVNDGSMHQFLRLLACLLIALAGAGSVAGASGVTGRGAGSGAGSGAGLGHAGTPADVVDVRLQEAAVVTDSPHVTRVGRDVMIAAPGTYRLSGRLYGGRLVVASRVQGSVTLLLDGLSVYAATGPALVVEAAERVVLHLAAGSYNNFFDGLERLAGEPGSALHSEAPLTVAGEGHLLVMARLKHGVSSEGRLRIDGGVVTVSAADDGVRGKDLSVNGGDVLVFSANDALKATGDSAGSGVVELNGGRVDLVAQGDGVQAERVLVVRGGVIDVLAGGGHTVTPGEASTKGLKADEKLVIKGGTIRVDSSDDAVHSDGRVRIHGGHLTLATGDDAVHADVSLVVTGGWVEVTASWEGLEAPLVRVEGGTVLVVADDDALNAAGEPPPEELLIHVSGGRVVLNAGSDAMDSNGGVMVTGGTVVLNGPNTFFKPAIDRHLWFPVLLGGGTVVAAGTLVVGQEAGIDPRSTQAVLYMNLHLPVAEGAVLTIRSGGGDVATFRAPQTTWRVSFTSPAIEAGAEYELWLGGTPVGVEAVGGVFEPAGVAGAEFARLFRAR